MLNRLILKVTKFQLPPTKRLGTVVKNILGAIMAPPCQIGLSYPNKLYIDLWRSPKVHCTEKGLYNTDEPKLPD